MIFDDFISPCQDFDEKIKDRRPLFLRKERPFFKKKLTDMISWKKINRYINTTLWTVDDLHQEWNEKGRLSLFQDLDKIDPRIYEIRDEIESRYGAGYQCEPVLCMYNEACDWSEIYSSETDGFFLQLIGSTDWEVFPVRAKNKKDLWQPVNNDLYIPIVEKTTMESDIMYLPRNIFLRARP